MVSNRFLREIREAAAEEGDMQLLDMNDRELRAAVLENYSGEHATRMVVGTRAVSAGHS